MKNNEETKNNKRTECLVYSRVCGWLVPHKQMNLGKRAERDNMKYYKIKED